MTGISHIAIGSSIGLIIVSGQKPIAIVIGVVIAIFGSLLPDLDANNSTLQMFLHQGGKPTWTNKILAKGNDLFSGLLFMFLSVVEMGIRMIMLSIMEIFKLFVGHRGITHYGITGIVMAIILAIISRLFNLNTIYSMAFLGGYLSHLLADAMTKSGIPLLAPFSQKTIYLLPKKWLVRTWDWKEYILAGLITVICWLIVWLRYK